MQQDGHTSQNSDCASSSCARGFPIEVRPFTMHPPDVNINAALNNIPLQKNLSARFLNDRTKRGRSMKCVQKAMMSVFHLPTNTFHAMVLPTVFPWSCAGFFCKQSVNIWHKDCGF